MSGFISTDQVFIRKLTEIIHANIADENFGVDELSHLSGMSRSVIHRRLQSISNISTKQFIREIRLQQAMELLQHEVTTASEVAYRVGFGSPAYFNTCFHEHYGFPPGEVLKNGIRESIQGGGSSTTDPEAKEPELTKSKPSHEGTKQSGWNITGRHLIISGFIVILIIFGLAYLLDVTLFKNNNPSARTLAKNKDKSISVLPFKGINIEEDNRYFAEAVTKNILMTLIQIRELRVVTGFPMKEYSEDPLNIRLIAKKLGVRYLLVGSVQKQGSQVNVTVLLIDAIQNQYVWSKEYIKEFSDLFLIQSSIARNIASNLQTILTPEDITQIEKIPTQNMAAYSYYLKGRYYLTKWSWKEIDKSREYFEKAIAADSTFAEAYAGLADYMLNCGKRNLCPKQATHEKAKNLVRRALELDDNLAEAHATMGEILCDEWEWEEARDEFRRAIQINYNCPTAHQYYSGLLSILRHNEESRTEINLAVQLDPGNQFLLLQSAQLHINEEKFEGALNECSKVVEMDSSYYSVYWTYYNIYLRLGEKQKAFESLQKALSLFPEDERYIKMAKEYFEKEGINGLPKMIIKMHDVDDFGIIGTAKCYSFLGDKKRALSYLEKAMALKLPGLANINNDIAFSTLRNEPGFQALIKKMGLARYQNIVPANSSKF